MKVKTKIITAFYSAGISDLYTTPTFSCGAEVGFPSTLKKRPSLSGMCLLPSSPKTFNKIIEYKMYQS